MDSKLVLAALTVFCVSLTGACSEASPPTVGEKDPMASWGALGGESAEAPTRTPDERLVAPTSRPPSIWEGVEPALYHIELAGGLPAGLVLQGLSVRRNRAPASDVDLLVRIHLRYPEMEKVALDQTLASLVWFLDAQRSVRSCEADYELTQDERAAGISLPVIALGLEVPDAPALDPQEDPSKRDGSTVVREQAADRAVQIGRVDVTILDGRYVVRPGQRGRGLELWRLRAFVQALEASPILGAIEELRLERLDDSTPPRQWRWELVVLRRAAEG